MRREYRARLTSWLAPTQEKQLRPFPFRVPPPSVPPAMGRRGLWVRVRLLLAGLLAVTGVGARRGADAAAAGRARRRTIPSPGSRRSRGSGRWPGRGPKIPARSARFRATAATSRITTARSPSSRRATAFRRSPSAPTASTISGRTPSMSAASSGARRSPATAPTRRPGRRCSTSTRLPRPRANPGSIRA